MSGFVDRFFFGQPSAPERLAAVRITLGAIVAILVLLGPYGSFHVEMADLLYRPSGFLSFIPALDTVSFVALRVLVIASAAMAAAGLFTRISCVVAAISFLVFNYYVSQFVGTAWNYNTHLNWFFIALCFGVSGTRLSLDARFRGLSSPRLPAWRSSFVLALMQFYVAVLYTQAGLAKVLGPGVDWFTSGKTPFYFALVGGTDFGRWCTQWPELFSFFTLTSGLLELFFLPLFLIPRLRVWLVWAAMLMHIGIQVILDISFWHLWLLFPALFLWRSAPGNQPSEAPGQTSSSPASS